MSCKGLSVSGGRLLALWRGMGPGPWGPTVSVLSGIGPRFIPPPGHPGQDSETGLIFVFWEVPLANTETTLAELRLPGARAPAAPDMGC